MNDLIIQGITMARNMTTGNITKHLISYSVPLILGNMFQLTYNAVDSIIVGKFAGEKALAAVGTANPIMNIIVFFIIGICMGASVLMSEFYGAGKIGELKKEIFSTMIVGGIFTIVISISCILFAKQILMVIKTPNEILFDSAKYLRIIFMGLIFTHVYNVFAYALRSIGDTKTPIYFLMISSVVNASLDLILVGIYHYGVTGAALATVIAEAMSGILCVIYVYRKVPMVSIKKADFKLEKYFITKTIFYSWFTSMQQTALYVGKVLVQGAVNPLGVASIAAFNAVNRVDDFAFMPEQSIAQGITTFIAQNRGAGNKERIKKGLRTGLVIEVLYWILLFFVVFVGAKYIMQLFVPAGDSNMVDIGTKYLMPMAVFYLLPAFTNGIQGYFRGMGMLNITLMATLTQMIARVIASYILASHMGVQGIAYACLIGWVAMMIFEIPIFIVNRRKHI